MLNPGMMLSGRYEIIETVGSGGMSEVYKAKCHVLNRFVAIKVLKPEFSSDVNFVTKFRIEAQSAAGLSHPNIVNVYDVGEDEGIYYIVMELVEGITLKEYIQKNGRIAADQAIDFAIQIAQGLEAAHEHHTIHRDIKPQNIIVARNGSIKVTDFGIARAASSNTMTSNAMGSVHYISPEQARGGYSDERSDIYSLGITMYEMVTGHVPFEGENNVAIALMHIQGDMVSPREYYPDIPISLEKVILKCTQKKPERRYLTASALIADLKRVKENPNIDCIVVPPEVNNSPTVKMTQEEMQAIKQGRQLGVSQQEQSQGTQPDSRAESRINVPVMKPSAIDDLFPEDDEDEDDYEYENEGNGVVSQASRQEAEEDDELDPKLKKIIMISSVALVVIVAILIIFIIGKIAGWNLFGGVGTEKKTEAISTENSEVSTEEEKMIPMVNVVGLYKTAAEEQMKKNGFTNYEFAERNDNNVEEGYVIEQNIEEGKSIAADEKIIITISSGKEMTTVPDVRNYTDEQAVTLLKEAGLEVTHAYEYDDTVEKDHVISQDPAGGSEVAQGTTIKITVSNGKETVIATVPDVVGMSESDAADAISAAKLVGAPTYDFSDDVPAGEVISQDPAVNTQLEEGSTVTYVVSNGKENHTYTATFSGSVTNNNYDFETFGNVNVEITYTIDGNVYSIYSGAAGTESFPLDISGTQAITGLTANSGSFSVIISDSDGIDVTSSFNTGGISATFAQE
ncbi:MAG: Stk1 family PASTA domain-containing Ser/Thr kinase [Coprococcus sp.]